MVYWCCMATSHLGVLNLSSIYIFPSSGLWEKACFVFMLGENCEVDCRFLSLGMGTKTWGVKSIIEEEAASDFLHCHSPGHNFSGHLVQLSALPPFMCFTDILYSMSTESEALSGVRIG